jgi:hypothetical protein
MITKTERIRKNHEIIIAKLSLNGFRIESEFVTSFGFGGGILSFIDFFGKCFKGQSFGLKADHLSFNF